MASKPNRSMVLAAGGAAVVIVLLVAASLLLRGGDDTDSATPTTTTPTSPSTLLDGIPQNRAILGSEDATVTLIQFEDFLTPNAYALLKKIPEAMGLKGNFYSDPADAQQQPEQAQLPPPDPLAETRMKQETELQKEAMRQETELTKEQMRQQPVVVPINAGIGL